MNKIKNLIILIILLISCSLNNTPTSKIEELMGKYQSLNKDIEINYNYLGLENNKKEIKELIKKQYKNMTFEIKEEKIDGDYATVTTEIEVLNYKNILNNYTNEEEIINNLKKVKDTIVYTIEFTLTKNNKGKWELDDLNEEQKNKLLGIY